MKQKITASSPPLLIGQKPRGGPPAEISYRHFAAQDECSCPRKEAKDHQQPACNLQRTGKSVKCPEIVVHSSTGEAPQLFGSVLEKEQAYRNSQHAEKVRRPPGGGLFGWHTHSNPLGPDSRSHSGWLIFYTKGCSGCEDSDCAPCRPFFGHRSRNFRSDEEGAGGRCRRSDF